MTVRLLIGILNISVNNTRIEIIKCDRSLKSQELPGAIESLISYWTNWVEIIIVRIYWLFLLFVTWNTLLRLQKLCNSVYHRLVQQLLEVREDICWFRIKNWRLESPYSDQLRKINKSVSPLLWHFLLSFEHRGRYSHILFMNAPHTESHQCSLTSSFK